MLVLCLTARVFITPRPPEEMKWLVFVYGYGGTMHVLIKTSVLSGLALIYSD